MKDLTLPTLKPCPFCGGEASARPRTCNRNTPYNPADRAFPIVRCGKCGAEAIGDDWKSEATAIEKWNRRAALSSHPTPDLQAVRDETIASGQHKDLIRACNLAGLSYADCMRIVAYMPVLSHHEDGGRAATSELEQMRERKDAAYLERNQVVAALAKCFPSGVARTAIEGWSEDWHGCVYIDLPTGQASWHFHDSHAYLFDSLPPYTGTWDGHDTPEKYARLAKLGVALGGEKGEPPCSEHPDAPHGYNRSASHNAGRYVCDCEGWAALGGEKGEAGWLPIESAPKDGSDVILSNGYWAFEATSQPDGTFIRTKDRRQTAPSNCIWWQPFPKGKFEGGNRSGG